MPLSAAIRRGIAVPRDLNEDQFAALAMALKAITADPAFKTVADAGGYLVTWIDEPTWAAQVETERQALAKMWETDPWLNASGG